MHKARSKPEYMELKLWGVPPGLAFVISSDDHLLKLSGIKDGCTAEGRNKLQFGDVLIDLDGKDVRGMLASEVKKLYRKTTREQGSHSTSELPPMWYMIFRRGQPVEKAMDFRPKDLVSLHGVSESQKGWAQEEDEIPGNAATKQPSLFKTKVTPVLRQKMRRDNQLKGVEL